jgi:hypothetical protein
MLINLSHIKTNIETTLKVSFDNTSRQREIVDARIIFCLISMASLSPQQKVLCTELQKDNACIVHYKRMARILVKTDLIFKIKYKECLKAIGIPTEKLEQFTTPEYIESITEIRKYTN